MTNWISRLAIALAGTLCLVACASPFGGPGVDPPIVSVVRLGRLEPGVFEQRFQLDVRLRNPNTVDLELDGLDLTIEVNGEVLTRALSGEPLTVPRLGQIETSITATTTPFDWLRQLQGSAGRPGQLRYAIRGRVLLARSLQWLPFESDGDMLRP